MAGITLRRTLTLKLFLSWSGDRSRGIAEALRQNLPLLMNAVEPWMSDSDIEKGARWGSVLSDVLGSAKVGIFCLTPLNLERPALLFEAGAISKSVSDSRVCVLLDGMEPVNVAWPWSQFQYTRLHDSKDMLKMLSDMNTWLIEGKEPAVPPERFSKAFDNWWPQLQEDLKKLSAEVEARPPERSERDMLAEVLEILRSQQRSAAESTHGEEEASFFRSKGLDNLWRLKQLSRRGVLEPPTLAQVEASYVEGEAIKRLFKEALDKEGHQTAAAQVASADVSIDGRGVCTITVPMRQAMVALTFNADAQRIMREAAEAEGLDITQLQVYPGAIKT